MYTLHRCVWPGGRRGGLKAIIVLEIIVGLATAL